MGRLFIPSLPLVCCLNPITFSYNPQFFSLFSSQVALLMVFGQKMVWKALETGQKQFGSLVDLSAQLVADVAADFIIREGGWVGRFDQ